MPYQATVFNVLIASPGDVQDERNIVREVIQEWNAVNSKSREIVLNAVGWETHSHPTMGDRAQGVLNKQLVDDADLVVAVFWTRIGSPTGEAPGGSVEELSRHMDAGKPAMVYFSSQPVEPDKAETQQYRDLKKFRDTWCEPRGLVQRYKTTDEFRNLFARHIAQKVNDDLYLQKHIKTNAGMMPVHVITRK
jgi:hypothetical protein